MGVSIPFLSAPGLLKVHTLEIRSLGSAGWALLNLLGGRPNSRGSRRSRCWTATALPAEKPQAPTAKTKAWAGLSSPWSRAKQPLEVSAGHWPGTPCTPMRMVPPGIHNPFRPSPRTGPNLPAAACPAVQGRTHKPQMLRGPASPSWASHSWHEGSSSLGSAGAPTTASALTCFLRPSCKEGPAPHQGPAYSSTLNQGMPKFSCAL